MPFRFSPSTGNPALTNSIPPDLWRRVKDFYMMPFRAIVAVGRLFGRNRRRIRDFVRRPQVADTLKYGMMITLITWLAVAMLNKEEGNRLNEAMKSWWPIQDIDKKDTGNDRD